MEGTQQTTQELEGQQEDQSQQDNQQTSDTISKEEYERIKKEKEELEKNYKDSTREAQKLHWINEVGFNPAKFEKLYNSDKKIAQEVTDYLNKKHGNNATMEDYLAAAKGESKEYNDTFDKEQLKAEVRKEYQEQQAETTLNNLLQENGVKKNDDFGKDVMQEFNDLIAGKEYTPENVEKYFKKALREASMTSEHYENYKQTMQNVVGAGAMGGNNKPVQQNNQKQQKVSEKYKKSTIHDYVKNRKQFSS